MFLAGKRSKFGALTQSQPKSKKYKEKKKPVNLNLDLTEAYKQFKTVFNCDFLPLVKIDKSQLMPQFYQLKVSKKESNTIYTDLLKIIFSKFMRTRKNELIETIRSFLEKESDKLEFFGKKPIFSGNDLILKWKIELKDQMAVESKTDGKKSHKQNLKMQEELLPPKNLKIVLEKPRITDEHLRVADSYSGGYGSSRAVPLFII